MFLVHIYRYTKENGFLTYFRDDEEVVAQVDCFFDPDNNIPAGSYDGCSKTYLTRAYEKVNGKADFKQLKTGTHWQGIYVPGVRGYEGNFIHQGARNTKTAKWSLGCMVLDYTTLMKIWDDITPVDGRNVSLVVEGGT